jgi:hypothetical protein
MVGLSTSLKSLSDIRQNLRESTLSLLMPGTLLRSVLTVGIPTKGTVRVLLFVAVNAGLNSMLTSTLPEILLRRVDLAWVGCLVNQPNVSQLNWRCKPYPLG